MENDESLAKVSEKVPEIEFYESDDLLFVDDHSSDQATYQVSSSLSKVSRRKQLQRTFWNDRTGCRLLEYREYSNSLSLPGIGGTDSHRVLEEESADDSQDESATDSCSSDNDEYMDDEIFPPKKRVSQKMAMLELEERFLCAGSNRGTLYEEYSLLAALGTLFPRKIKEVTSNNIKSNEVVKIPETLDHLKTLVVSGDHYAHKNCPLVLILRNPSRTPSLSICTLCQDLKKKMCCCETKTF
jgi:hypothetical protein